MDKCDFNPLEGAGQKRVLEVKPLKIDFKKAQKEYEELQKVWEEDDRRMKSMTPEQREEWLREVRSYQGGC